MNGAFIKVLDKKTADQLMSVGFSYMTEKFNNQDIYVFPRTSELMELLKSLFSDNGFVCESKLRFESEDTYETNK